MAQALIRINYKKIGGMRFLRIGRLQFSWCVCRPAIVTEADKAAKVERREAARSQRKAARNLTRWYESGRLVWAKNN